jgi:hypothetical protein
VGDTHIVKRKQKTITKKAKGKKQMTVTMLASDDETPSGDGGHSPTYQESNDITSSSSDGDTRDGGDIGVGGNTSSPPLSVIRFTCSIILQIYVIIYVICFVLHIRLTPHFSPLLYM